jgi:hypothetical protein
MKSRLWVIEWCFIINGVEHWDVCDTSIEVPKCSTNFYEAHKNKKKIYKILKREYNKNWTKKCFRVVEYIPK